jgi:hypothetical protein
MLFFELAAAARSGRQGRSSGKTIQTEQVTLIGGHKE